MQMAGLLAGVLFLIAIVYGAWYFRAAQRGYCFAEKRVISDTEFIIAAIRRESSRINIQESRASAEAFLTSQPHCCRVVGRNVGSFLDTIFGYATVEVEMYYQIMVGGDSPSRPSYYHQYTVINRCGDVGRVYGEAVNRHQIPQWAK
jgi:hypothetical protein